MLGPARFLVWNLNTESSPKINTMMLSMQDLIVLWNIKEYFIPE